MTGPMLHRVCDALSGDGELLDAEELRDALWLAARLPPAAATALARLARAAEPAAEAATPAPGESAAAPSFEGGDEHRGSHLNDHRNGAPPGATAIGGGARTSQEDGLHAAPVPPSQVAPSDRSAMAVRAPGMKALDGTELRIGRALRPLRQLRPDALRTELDVDATVSAMAETGLPDAVLRPARTRWLDLAVLVDDGVSMLLWQRLAGEVRALMERCGAFRDVRLHGLDSRTPGGPRLTGRPYGGRDRARPMSTVLDPSGNTLLLVVSDGVGRAWRDGTMHRELDRAAATGPVALLHALPPRLWAGSGIDARPWRVTTRRRGAANRSWHVEDPVLPPELAPYDGVPVPVLSAEGSDIGTWAQLIGSPGETVVLPLLNGPDTPAPAIGARASTRPTASIAAEEAVLRFKTSASSEAYRLAAHLAAVAPLPVPAMRLVQYALQPSVDTAHLAEVFLGGLMHGVAGAADLPHQKTFDFTEDIRTVLLRTVPPSELVRTARAVTAHLSGLPNASTGFPAWLPHSEGPERVRSGSRRPFGWVDETLRRRLGIAPPAVPEQESEPEAEPPHPHGELREIPDDFVLNEELTGWRRLPVADRRFEGPDGLPYEVFAEHEGGWSDIGLLLAHDGEGRVLVIRTPEVSNPRYAVDLVTTEVTALKRLDGFFAPRLLAWDAHRLRPWLAVECALDGASEPAPNLHDFVGQEGTLHQAGLLEVARQLAASLANAHQNGLVHGSLTPRRVLVAGQKMQITGWMTASVDGRTSPHWDAYGPRPRYRAPELNLPGREPTRESDVYALGIILLDAATGAGQEADPSEPMAVLPAGLLSTDWTAILESCTQRDPAHRPSAARLQQAFDSLALQRPGGSRPMRVSLGLDPGLDPVGLDLESEHRGGQGPHLLLRGLPAAIRRNILRRMLDQLMRQNPTGLELVRADYDGRSGLTRSENVVRGASFLRLRDHPAHVHSFCEELRQEVTKRWNMLGKSADDSDFGALAQDADEFGIPHVLRRLVVVVEDFQQLLLLAPEVFTILRQVAEQGPRLGMHLIVSTDDTDGALADRVFAEGTPARIDLRGPTRGGEDPSGRLMTRVALQVPLEMERVFFTAGVEDTSEPRPGN
ncbi:SAV_2336 N-terminal domain-related protein [Streptomyces sp. NPDC097704]|uniref:SAV_2336 N-terminal domain-related protein n=1 Tax=Streptomyces sp. NPDC097704 TaxID=3157101 RepID=UPI00332F8BBD